MSKALYYSFFLCFSPAVGHQSVEWWTAFHSSCETVMPHYACYLCNIIVILCNFIVWHSTKKYTFTKPWRNKLATLWVMHFADDAWQVSRPYYKYRLPYLVPFVTDSYKYILLMCGIKVESPVKYNFEWVGSIYVWVTFIKSGSYYNGKVLSPEHWKDTRLDLTIEFLLNELFCKMSLVWGQISQPLKMASVEMSIKKAFISHIANIQTNFWTFFPQKRPSNI